MLLCLLIAAALRLPKLEQFPPGLHFDEAANGILAAEIGISGESPVFITSYTGKEVLFFYAAGILMRFVGQSIFTLRLAAAFLGLLTVATTYWLGWELFRDRRIALLAAALLAVSFWHVLFSRLGFRAVSQPLLQALTVAALFRGLQRNSRLWLVTGGAALGLTGYTYLAARAFPIPLAISLLPLLLSRDRRRRRWQQLALFAATGLIVLLPLLLFFVSNPEAFWVRVDQVLPAGVAAATLARSYLESLGMFFLAGDPYWRFNIPGRPLFSWFWGGLFVAGWLVSLLRWLREQSDLRRAAYLLVVLVPIFMIVPAALAVGEIVPSNLRSIGLIPFAFFLPTLGLITLLEAASKGLRLLQSRPAIEERLSLIKINLPGRPAHFSIVLLAIFALILVFGGVMTSLAYFQRWATRADLFYDSDADLAAVAQFLDEQGSSENTVFLSALHYRHPTVAFLSDAYEQIKWLPGGQALVFPADGSALYVFPHSTPLPDWASGFLSDTPLRVGPAGPDGKPTFIVYESSVSPTSLGRGPMAQPGLETDSDGWSGANFGNQITLLNYEVGTGTAGQHLPLTLYWRVDQPPTANIMPFVHLEDNWRYRWSQVESFAYPAEQWAVGDIVVQRVELPLHPGMPPGLYQLRIGFFESASGRQLSLLDESGRYAGNAFSVESVPIAAGPMPVVVPRAPIILDQAAGSDLTLLGYERAGEQVMAGAATWVALWWAAEATPDPLTTRIELVRPDSTGLILLDTQPVHDTYPFVSWLAPQVVIDHVTPEIPSRVPPGDYRLRLRLLDGADETVMIADLGPLYVEASERLFSPPIAEFPFEATFGNEIQFKGYDLEAVEEGRFSLDLIWQALVDPADRYTVFVHVLDLEGKCCVWQQDAYPGQGQRPTDGWLANEVIIDSYVIDLPPELPPGQYPVEIGLYLAESGQRLLVEVPKLRSSNALLLRPLSVE